MSLARLFDPRSVAVVGATPRRSMGRQLLNQVKAFGFAGEIYPVNPKYDEVLDLPCYPSVSAIDGPIDVVAVATPPSTVPGILKEAYDKGARAAVLVSGGLGSAGDALGLGELGMSDMVACGPNCLGLISVANSFAPFSAGNENFRRMLLDGDCAVVSQSGGLLLSTMYLGSIRGLGFNYLISSGNETLTDGPDYLEHFTGTDDVRTVCWVMEGVADGQRLESALAGFRAAGKNLVVLPIGRSPRGRESALSHTGALMGEQRALEALLAEYGVASVRTLNEMVETALFLQKSKRPTTPGGPAVLAVSGGTVAMAADLSAEVGLDLPRLAPETLSALAEVIPAAAEMNNPLDLDLGVLYDQSDALGGLLTTISNDPGVNQVIAIVPIDPWGGSKNMRAFIAGFQEFSKHSPVPACMIANTTDGLASAYKPHGEPLEMPFLQDMHDGLAAIRRARVALAHSAPGDDGGHDEAPLALDAGAETALRDAVERARAAGEATIDEIEGKALLARAGFRTVAEVVVESREALDGALDAMTWPAVAKAVSPQIAHRAKHGLVKLDIQGPGEAVEAYESLVKRCEELGTPADAVVFQEQVAGELEIVLGVGRDPVFGPCVVVGAGGVLTEVLDDTVLIRALSASPPIAASYDRVLAKYLDHLNLGERYRGPVCEAIARAVAVARVLPAEVDSLDINPVVLSAGECVVVDALLDLSAGA